MAKRKTPTKTYGVAPTQFRLEPEILADLDVIARHIEATAGVPANRTAAARVAIRREADRVKALESKAK